jgi:hypothetical protein
MIDYVTLAEALAIHDDQIKRYGGSPGVRDLGLLVAALSRSQTGYYSDLIQEAAALWESLSQNHPFIETATKELRLPSPILSFQSTADRSPPMQWRHTRSSLDCMKPGISIFQLLCPGFARMSDRYR